MSILISEVGGVSKSKVMYRLKKHSTNLPLAIPEMLIVTQHHFESLASMLESFQNAKPLAK